MIEKLRIRNFRSIKSVIFDKLGNLNVFVGENNSGKSTVLNAINIFYKSLYTPSINDIRHGSNSFEITVVKSLDDLYYRRIHEDIRHTTIYESFIEEFEKNISNRTRYTRVYWDLFEKFINQNYFKGVNYRKIGIKMICSLNDSFEFDVSHHLVSSNFRDIGISIQDGNYFLLKSFIDSPAIVEDERNFSSEVTGEPDSITNSVFSLFLDSINELHEYNIQEIYDKKGSELTIGEINFLLSHKMSLTSNEFLETINNKFHNYIDKNFKIEWNFEEELKSRVRLETQFLNSEGNSIDFLSTGSGMRSLYILALFETYIQESKDQHTKSGLFLIEEPELYLYPTLERKMSSILKDISVNNQLFITTHSSGLVSNFNLEDIYLVEGKNDVKIMESVYSSIDDLTELTNAIGFNAHPIFSGNYIFIVEGKDDISNYKSVIRNHFPNKLDSCTFLKVNSVKNVEVGVTCQLLKKTELLEKLFIIIDSDGREKNKIKNQYMDTLRHEFTSNELDRLLDERFYITENASNLECLSFNPILIPEIERNDFYLNVDTFIEINSDLIEERFEQLRATNNKRYHPSLEKIKNKIFDKELNIEKRFLLLKKHVLSSRLIKKFRNEVFVFPMLKDVDYVQQILLVPDLLEKLAVFLNDIDVRNSTD